jgi:hypothetical protein
VGRAWKKPDVAEEALRAVMRGMLIKYWIDEQIKKIKS